MEETKNTAGEQPVENIPATAPSQNAAGGGKKINAADETAMPETEEQSLNDRPLTDSNDNMEVHHHTHHEHGKRSWKSYFWEFLMLFLAVFCGFLAEYQLEHVIEKGRENQFMISLVEDLETDTVELKSAIGICDSVSRYSDSALIFFTSFKMAEYLPAHIAGIISTAGQRQNLINTDRTSSQLKNSGAMRLIRKKKSSDAILRYWKLIEVTQISLDRYMIYRDAGRAIVFKLWVVPNVYRRGMLIPADSLKKLRVIDTDKKKWDEMTNLLAMSGAVARVSHSKNLKNQLRQAIELITLIKKEYHLE